MKLLAVLLAGGLFAGGFLLVEVWQDPRQAGPAPIPQRYLEKAEAACVEGLSRAGEAAAGVTAFCGCVAREVGRQFTFRDFRAARVEVEKARARSGSSALPHWGPASTSRPAPPFASSLASGRPSPSSPSAAPGELTA